MSGRRAAALGLGVALAVALAPAAGCRRKEEVPSPPPRPLPAAPQGTGAPAGVPSEAELLAQVDANRERLVAAPKTLEIAISLGDLYYGAGRFAEADVFFGQARALAAPGWRIFDALPPADREAARRAPTPPGCGRTRERGFVELMEEAERLGEAGEAAAANACLWAAVAPSLGSEIHRAVARAQQGDAAAGTAAVEWVLARAPGHPGALAARERIRTAR